MVYKTTYSNGLTTEKVRVKFLRAKYPNRVRCDWCNSVNVYTTDSVNKTRWRCRDCWRKFSLTRDTYIEQTKMDLRWWYEVVWHFAIMHSAHKASKLLEMPGHRSVLRAYGRIRQSLLDYSERVWGRSKDKGVNDSEVYELDESYFGGKFKNLRKKVRKELRAKGLVKRGRGAKHRKQPVFGIYRRDGNVYLKPIPSCDAEILEPVIEGIIPKDSEIYTDTFRSYNGLEALGYIHATINHRDRDNEYVNGTIHINGLEGFWGLAKTNMHTYKGIRKKNWIYYLKEMEFRYNFRGLEYGEMVNKIIRLLMKNFG